MQMVSFVALSQQWMLQEGFARIILNALDNPDIQVQYVAARMIFLVLYDKRPELAQKLVDIVSAHLKRSSITDQWAIAQMFFMLSDALQRSFFESAKIKLGNFLVEPPLYQGAPTITSNTFARAEFEKDGSTTTLLGGPLKDKTIIRHIKPQAFLMWQKLYEDYALWAYAGFDYVPIEPIQSFRLNNNGLVDVYSGVLDLNLSAWEAMTDDFVPALKKDCENILKVLNKARVNHGHMHKGNFILRFFRDSSGNVDFTKKPRAYLIDFDAARPGRSELEF